MGSRSRLGATPDWDQTYPVSPKTFWDHHVKDHASRIMEELKIKPSAPAAGGARHQGAGGQADLSAVAKSESALAKAEAQAMEQARRKIEESDRELLEQVKQNLGIQKLAAVVIDANLASSPDRQNIEEQVKAYWGFDAVAIVANEREAEQRILKLRAEYSDISFLRIGRLENGFAFGIIDMEGLDMLMPQTDINDAIREYLNSV